MEKLANRNDVFYHKQWGSANFYSPAEITIRIPWQAVQNYLKGQTSILLRIQNLLP